MRFTGSAAMAAMDRYAIDVLGIPGKTLMLRAARGAADGALRLLEENPGRTLVFCGGGNNGGDGIGIAAFLLEAGKPVSCYMVGDENKLSADGRAMKEKLLKAGGALLPYDPEEPFPEAAVLVVDALFGTGLSRPSGGKYADLLDRINKSCL